ncbi:DUF2238 domain-containing protein [Cocleimonas sp. KMM 6892]|uniref:DUF2238 domain-containing protein n=1 Tax=unclassified Cocleimonas TaxID=2639732 RepID=UPI002DBC305F|nr:MULTISPECIES: DUF2238 domain-containing protein [unclassified Cocleimonas]MEB8434423.1 DUF2238 domain-containing protein [Cocleimonas sp. KMM 6892]MEC4717316.1 DUF2238 domain-containing protein [Cocleimonas sp. KMM 6895]MEC4746695.1 DUF2238 domain-containing protein [Cocleimonas sp. KMM 6896]
MRWLVIFSVFFFAVWADSFIGTTDIANWRIENTLTAITVLCLIFTFKWYRFSTLSYFLICAFLCLHVYGSKYTYAENPFGYWLQDILQTSRNPYDRLVHTSFGLLLYYPFYEILLNGLKLRKREALIIPVLIVLSASAIYEMIEWLVADKFFVEQGISYLGTQGDVWDSQEDMFVAFIGSLLAALIFYVYRLSFGKRAHKMLKS